MAIINAEYFEVPISINRIIADGGSDPTVVN
jgi:hypothetical protein